MSANGWIAKGCALGLVLLGLLVGAARFELTTPCPPVPTYSHHRVSARFKMRGFACDPIFVSLPVFPK